jgi:hypothetical protein
MALNWKSETSLYDFGFESSYNGLPQSSNKPRGKKIKLMERSKEEIKPKEKSVYGEVPSEFTESGEMSGDESDIADAVDMAFMPGTPAPSMMGGLKQYYPELARELNVEATVYVSVIINRKGKVIKVKVSSVILSKKLPGSQESYLKERFAESIRKSFSEVIFTKPVIDGKSIPIEMEQVVRYTLTD